MDKTRRISENQCASHWSDLNHDLLCLVLMKLEVFDFIPFSGVCKSWRSFALSNKRDFLASKPPMSISITEEANKTEYLIEDSTGKMFEMRLPKSGGGRTCVGLTCGYMVLFGTNPCEFWLLNPVTRHGLCFPKVPRRLEPDEAGVRAILVFSPSIDAWVFVVLSRRMDIIWFSIAGNGVWHGVRNFFTIMDVHDFKGKIYAIDRCSRLYELKLDPEPKLTLLNTTYKIESDLVSLEVVCSDENLYAIKCFSSKEYEVLELDVGEMKLVSPDKKIMDENAFFISYLKHSAAIKPGLWSDSLTRYKKSAYSDSRGNGMFFSADLWYFAHDCLKVDLKHE